MWNVEVIRRMGNGKLEVVSIIKEKDTYWKVKDIPCYNAYYAVKFEESKVCEVEQYL